jgi:hypothetical protein
MESRYCKQFILSSGGSKSHYHPCRHFDNSPPSARPSAPLDVIASTVWRRKDNGLGTSVIPKRAEYEIVFPPSGSMGRIRGLVRDAQSN